MKFLVCYDHFELFKHVFKEAQNTREYGMLLYDKSQFFLAGLEHGEI